MNFTIVYIYYITLYCISVYSVRHKETNSKTFVIYECDQVSIMRFVHKHKQPLEAPLFQGAYFLTGKNIPL